jgi:hypothetical protein
VPLDEVVDGLHRVTSGGIQIDLPPVIASLRLCLRRSLVESRDFVVRLPEFSGLERGVSRPTEQVRQRVEIQYFVRGIALDSPLAQLFDPAVPLIRMQPGEQRSQGWATYARRDVSMAEQDSLARQAVQARRMDLGRTQEAEVGVAVVVADDEEDVRRFGCAAREDEGGDRKD